MVQEKNILTEPRIIDIEYIDSLPDDVPLDVIIYILNSAPNFIKGPRAAELEKLIQDLQAKKEREDTKEQERKENETAALEAQEAAYLAVVDYKNSVCHIGANINRLELDIGKLRDHAKEFIDLGNDNLGNSIVAPVVDINLLPPPAGVTPQALMIARTEDSLKDTPLVARMDSDQAEKSKRPEIGVDGISVLKIDGENLGKQTIEGVDEGTDEKKKHNYKIRWRDGRVMEMWQTSEQKMKIEIGGRMFDVTIQSVKEFNIRAENFKDRKPSREDVKELQEALSRQGIEVKKIFKEKEVPREKQEPHDRREASVDGKHRTTSARVTGSVKETTLVKITNSHAHGHETLSQNKDGGVSKTDSAQATQKPEITFSRLFTSATHFVASFFGGDEARDVLPDDLFNKMPPSDTPNLKAGESAAGVDKSGRIS